MSHGERVYDGYSQKTLVIGIRKESERTDLNVNGERGWGNGILENEWEE